MTFRPVKLELCITRYKEDLSWSDEFEDIRIVYQKDNDRTLSLHSPEPGSKYQKVNHLPNIGLHNYAVVTHIVERCDHLADRTIFVQGHPFDHSPNILNQIRGLARAKNPPEFSWLSKRVSRTGRGSKVDYYLSSHSNYAGYDEDFDFVFANMDTPDEFRFGWGEQFVVSADRIRKRPLIFYQNLKRMYEEENRKDSVLSYHNERWWGLIFNESM